MGIGSRLREAREARGLTQRELARQVGVTGAAIANYEAGTSHPKEQVLYRLLDALGVDANYLFQDCCRSGGWGLTPAELLHLARLRALDSRGREAVEAALSHEYRRASGQPSSGQPSSRPLTIAASLGASTEAELQAALPGILADLEKYDG